MWYVASVIFFLFDVLASRQFSDCDFPDDCLLLKKKTVISFDVLLCILTFYAPGFVDYDHGYFCSK